MSKIKVMSVFGTRPEAIKMAPLALELQRREGLESLICVTAQHREMLDSVMSCFGIKADADLNIMGKNQTLTDVTVRALKGLEGCFAEFEPDLVLVHGENLVPQLIQPPCDGGSEPAEADHDKCLFHSIFLFRNPTRSEAGRRHSGRGSPRGLRPGRPR